MPVVLHAAIALALAAPPQEGAPVERLVARLGAPSWQEREAASEKLLSLGREAIPALERALASADPEVRHRARGLLDQLHWQPPGGLSDRLSAVMAHYKTLPERERLRLLNDVFRELRRGAVPVLRQALRGDSSETVRSLALRHLVNVDKTVAEAELRSLARERPTAAWAWGALGDLSAGRGETDQATRAYENARKAGEKSQRLAESLARLYTRRGEWPKARDLYAELIAADPENGSYRLELGRCHHMLGEPAKAEAAWREVVRTRGGDPNAYIWLANAYEGIGSAGKALAALREGAERHPEAFELLRRLAGSLAARHQFGEAIGFYERAARAAESDYQRRALHVELTGKLRHSGLLAAHLRRKEAELARLDTEIAGLLRTLAERDLKAGDRAAARKALERLVALYPGTANGRWAAGKLRGLGGGD